MSISFRFSRVVAVFVFVFDLVILPASADGLMLSHSSGFLESALSLPSGLEHGGSIPVAAAMAETVHEFQKPRLELSDWKTYVLENEYPLANGYTVQHFFAHGRSAWVIQANGKPGSIIRDTGRKFEASPTGSLNTEWQVQQYLSVLYNFMGNYLKEHGRDIQLQDQVLKRTVDRLDVYRTLAQRRQTMAPVAPDYKVPQLPQPLKVALRVDPRASNFESVLFAQLLGNPDISVPVVVGVTPHQLFLTLHSSAHRYFLPWEVFSYDNKAGVITIYGRPVRVVSSWNEMTSEEWTDLNIHTVVSTYNAADESNAIRQHLHGKREGSPTSVHIVSIQPDLVSKTGRLYGDGFESNGIYVKSMDGGIQLPNSRIYVPIRLAHGFFQIFPGLKEKTLIGLNLNTPQRNDTPILDKPTQVGGAGNVVIGNGALALQMQKQFIGDSLNSANLKKPTIQYEQRQVGTLATLTLDMSLESFSNALKIKRIRLKGSLEETEKVLLEELQNEISGWKQLREELNLKFVRHDKLAPSYTRGSRSILVSIPQIQISVTGDGDQRQVSLSIPMMFDDQVKDMLQLERILGRIGEEETLNLLPLDAPMNSHHSQWQQQVDLAVARGTLPPRAPDLPLSIELRENPLNLGVMGLGRTGGLVVRNLARTLNIRLAAIAGVQPDDVDQALLIDTAQGSWLSNGEEVQIEHQTYESARGQKIGTVKINRDKSVAILARANPNQIRWSDSDVDVVFEATGNFTNPEDPAELLGHLESARKNGTGARAVLLSAPFKMPKDVKTNHPVIVTGMNDDRLSGYIAGQIEKHGPIVLSAASCTTTCGAFQLLANALAFHPDHIADILEKVGIFNRNIKVKILSANGVSVHAWTNTQYLSDTLRTRSMDDLSKYRSALAILASKTGLSKALKPLNMEQLAAIASVIDATSERVPIETGSHLITALTWEITGLTPEEKTRLLQKDTNAIFNKAMVDLQHRIYDEMVRDPRYRGAVEHRRVDEATGSNQIIGSRSAAIFDSQNTTVTTNTSAGGVTLNIRVEAWYDNENGFSSRQVATLDRLAMEMPMTGVFAGVASVIKESISWIPTAIDGTIPSFIQLMLSDGKNRPETARALGRAV